VAESADGFQFAVRPEIVDFQGIEAVREKIYHVYDPRITRLEGAYYIMFAMDMDGGCGWVSPGPRTSAISASSA